jgi:hypothetical protein
MSQDDRHWVHIGCPLCGWAKTFSPESKPAAIRKAFRVATEHFVGHRRAALRDTPKET